MADPDELPSDDPLEGEDFGEHDEVPEGKGFVPEFVRKVAWAGLGAVFMSEEGIRRLARQLKLPREALGLVLQQAEKTKDELGRVVTEEVRKFLQSERLRDELLKLMAGMTIEVKAEVRLVPDRVKGEAPSLLPKVKVGDLRTRYEGKKKPPGEPNESVSPGVKRRLPLVFVAVVIAVAWSNGFGFFPADRVVTWQLPVDYGAVRHVDLQIWHGDDLIKREERTFSGGINEELRHKVPLASGTYRSVSTVTFADGGSRSWVKEFAAADSVVLKP